MPLIRFEAKINFNTTRQYDLKWRKTCKGLKFDLEHFNGPQTKFIGDSLYKHPVFDLIFSTHNHKHIIIVLSWYLFEVLPPQIKCPDHPFSSTMMMSLKRLKSSLLSEEVLDYLMNMEGTIIDHLIIEQSCV